MSAVKHHCHQIALGFFRLDLSGKFDGVHTVSAGFVAVSDTELIFGGIDDRTGNTVVFHAQRFSGFGFIHTGADGADIEFAECIKSIFHPGVAIIAGVIVGKQNGIDLKRRSKHGTFRIAAVIGAAFVNGGILPGHGTFPLKHLHIGGVEKGFDLTGDLIDTFDQISAVFFSGAEIPGNDH